jgi:hypothetical protein
MRTIEQVGLMKQLRGWGRLSIATAASISALALPLAVVATPASAQTTGVHWAEGLPDQDRLDWQLIWTGHLNANLGTVEPGERREAVQAFQKSVKRKPTGLLDATDRALLASKAQYEQSMTGFTIDNDRDRWLRVGRPAMLSRTSGGGTGQGTTWTSEDGRFVVTSFLKSGGNATGLYELQCCQGGRKITYKGVKATSLILEGYDPDHRSFHLHARQVGDHMVGIMVTFPSGNKKEFERLVTAISSTMTPDVTRVAAWRQGSGDTDAPDSSGTIRSGAVIASQPALPAVEVPIQQPLCRRFVPSAGTTIVVACDEQTNSNRR